AALDCPTLKHEANELRLLPVRPDVPPLVIRIQVYAVVVQALLHIKEPEEGASPNVKRPVDVFERCDFFHCPSSMFPSSSNPQSDSLNGRLCASSTPFSETRR